MMAVTAIHQRRAKAVAKVGAMAVLSRREDYERTDEYTHGLRWSSCEEENPEQRDREKEWEKKESQMKMSDCNITDMHFMGLY